MTEREFFISNLLVRIYFITVMIKWTGLAPWEVYALSRREGERERHERERERGRARESEREKGERETGERERERERERGEREKERRARARERGSEGSRGLLSETPAREHASLPLPHKVTRANSRMQRFVSWC